MEASDFFKAKSSSVADLLGGPGVSFYIPAYQRQYNWSESQVARFVESTVHGLTELMMEEDSFTFLGTIITIKDENHKMIHPMHQGDLPTRINLVIDGQQRLTTIVLLMLALHERVRKSFDPIRKVSDTEKSPLEHFLQRELNDTLDQLKKLLVEDYPAGPNKTVPYLRVIRAYMDAWSRNEALIKYESPIASMVNDYGYASYGFDLDHRTTQFRPREFASRRELQPGGKRFRNIVTMLKNLVGEGIGEEKIQLPSARSLVNSQFVRDSLLKSLDTDLTQDILGLSDDDNYLQDISYLVLTRYLLNKVVLTSVEVKKEEYAFSVFETLNTTGQPLAPFETFVPLVMESVTLTQYEASMEKLLVDSIQGSLGNLDVEKNRKDAAEINISFALAECGFKLAKDLKTQRNFFRIAYKRVEDDPLQRLEFLQHFDLVARMKIETWGNGGRAKLPSPIPRKLSEEVMASLGFLAQLKHTIVLPILARFWFQIEQAKSDTEEAAISDFEAVVKAVTAFTVLYRAVEGPTAGIDNVYRQVIAGLNSPTSLGALHRSSRTLDGQDPPGHFSPLNSSQLIEDLRRRLTDVAQNNGSGHRGITDRKTFVSRASVVPIYDHSVVLTRFMMIAALHNSDIDPKNPGLYIKANRNFSNFLTPDVWSDENHATVEHVAPQTLSTGGGWDGEIYSPENTGLIHRLGNLTLCSKGLNPSLGNASWDRKRIAYKAFSLGNAQQTKEILESAVPPFNIESKLYSEARYQPFFKGIGEKVDDWDVAFIKLRSEHLLGLLWDNLGPWLNLPS